MLLWSVFLSDLFKYFLKRNFGLESETYMHDLKCENHG